MFYTSVETGQSQYPTKNVEYIGTFTANPSALREMMRMMTIINIQ